MIKNGIMKISLKDFGNIPKQQLNGIYDVDYATYYYVNGELHREDGPAFENIFGKKFWYINDKRHRLDGPAIEYYDEKFYYIEGKEYSKEEFDKQVRIIKMRNDSDNFTSNDLI